MWNGHSLPAHHRYEQTLVGRQSTRRVANTCFDIIVPVSYNTIMKKTGQQAIDSIVAQVVANYKPEKIILFGSAASGTMGPDSDIDMVVIKNTSERFYDRISSVRSMIQTKDPLDILVYTPQEYLSLSRDSWFVGEEIVQKGNIVYGV